MTTHEQRFCHNNRGSLSERNKTSLQTKNYNNDRTQLPDAPTYVNLVSLLYIMPRRDIQRDCIITILFDCFTQLRDFSEGEMKGE